MANSQGIEIVDIPTRNLLPNEGQIAGVPSNPREIKRTAFAKLMQSIQEDPELLTMKPVLAYPLADEAGKYVVIAGNMRLRACTLLSHATMPAVVLPQNTPQEKLRRYALKDNASYGDWNFDLLSSDWSEIEVADANIIPTEWAELPQSEPKGLPTYKPRRHRPLNQRQAHAEYDCLWRRKRGTAYMRHQRSDILRAVYGTN